MGKVRVLFGCVGWPSGVLEIASWAKRQDLADVVIVPVMPGLAFRLEPHERQYLAPGPVHPELAESFVLHGKPLGADAQVIQAAENTWEVLDPRRGVCYRVEDRGDRLEVTVPQNYQRPEFDAVIKRFARSQPDPSRFLGSDGSLRAEVRQALMTLGGAFVGKLIAWCPHVVGRRIEAGQLEEVKEFVRAVRLFSDAEIVLGGPTATSHPMDVLVETGADYVFAGEAEEPFNQFLRLAWQRNSRDRMPEIPGLAYWYGGRPCHNTLPADGYERTALDEPRGLEGPARRCLRNAVRPAAPGELIVANRLDWSLLDGFADEFESLYFTGGRGCPGACTFCARLHGPEVRVKTAEQLLEEIASADALVTAGTLRVARWRLFGHVDDAALRDRLVSWAAIYDEDFFLDRRRAIEFFQLWEASPLCGRYRIGVQTNPCSLLDAAGEPHAELFRWIDRLKPMIQLGAESFHPEVLRRWHKRHTVHELRVVLDALDATRQDYGVFILLSDFDSTPEEIVDALRLLALEAFRRQRMRIASSPFTIPLYDSDIRKRLDYRLEYRGWPANGRVGHFTDYERVQPRWMDPLAAELADLADAELRFALNLVHRDAALVAAIEAVAKRIVREHQTMVADRRNSTFSRERIEQLRHQAEWTLQEVREAQYRAIESPASG